VQQRRLAAPGLAHEKNPVLLGEGFFDAQPGREPPAVLASRRLAVAESG
jgi:hypothetical protein